MKKNNELFIPLVISLCLLAILTIASVLVQEETVAELISSFSRDRVVQLTTITAVKVAITKILGLLLAFNVFLILITWIDVGSIVKKLSAIVRSINWGKLFDALQNKYAVNSFILVLFIYFLVMCLLFVFKSDVGVDEGLYISAVKNFYETGKFNLPWRDYSSVALQLVYYPFFLIKSLTGFSIYSLRIVSFIYSSLLLLFLLLVFRAKYSLKAYVILLMLLVTDRSYTYISSSGFGEIAALLSLVLGIYFLTARNGRHHVIVSALFFALAALTKLQLLPFILFVGVLFVILNERQRKENLFLFLLICLFWLIGEFVFGFVQGYDIAAIGRSFWRLSSATSAMAEGLPIYYRLAHINAFFSIFNIIIFTVVYVYYAINFSRVSLFEKTLVLFSFLITLWWVFFFVAMSSRNLVYAVVINYILMSIIVGNSVSRLSTVIKRETILAAIALFFTLSLINMTVFAARFARKGISDEVDFAVAGYESFSIKGIESAQKEFFQYINEELEQESEIYYISVDYYKYIFTEKEFISIERNTKHLELPQGSYFILTYVDYKVDYVWNELVVYLNNNADLVFRKDFYEIYRIRK